MTSPNPSKSIQKHTKCKVVWTSQEILPFVDYSLGGFNPKFCNYSPRDHALQNQKGAKLCDQHEKETHVVMQSHLGASVPWEASKRECKNNYFNNKFNAYSQIK